MDRGSVFLLKSLSDQSPVASSIKSVLDVGCGTGVLGITLKCLYPHLRLYGVDRDALAVRVSQINAELNGIRDASFKGALGLELSASEQRSWDLIVSNLPAKAGTPVLMELINSFCESVDPGGLIGLVIVRTLRDVVEPAIAESNGSVVWRGDSRGHSVFHLRPPALQDSARKRPECFLAPYIRSRVSFEVAGTAYELSTAFNLTDFDTIGYGTRLALDLLQDLEPEGRILCWNPGQGHIPVWLSRKFGRRITRYTLAGRDLLALEMSSQNLGVNAVEAEVDKIHTPFPIDLSNYGFGPIDQLANSMNLQVYLVEADPNSTWPRELLERAKLLASPSGKMLVVATSTTMHRMLGQRKPSGIVREKRNRGYRGILLSCRK